MDNIENSKALFFKFSLISPSSTNPYGRANNIIGFVNDPLFRKEAGSLISKVFRPPKSMRLKADSVDDITSVLANDMTCTHPNPEPSINKQAANIEALL